MEDIRNKTYDQILGAKSKKEVEAIMSKALFKLAEHGVHNYIISRFVIKLRDKLEENRDKAKDIKKHIALNEAIILLDEIDFSKVKTK